MDKGSHPAHGSFSIIKEGSHSQIAGCHLPAVVMTANMYFNVNVVTPAKYKKKQNILMLQCCLFWMGIKEDPCWIYFILRAVWRAMLSPDFHSRKFSEATLENHSFSILNQILIAPAKGGSFSHSLHFLFPSQSDLGQ